MIKLYQSRQVGLGSFSEQVVEAVHYEFLEATWKIFKASKSHSQYSSYLKKATLSYNGKCMVNIADEKSKLFNITK